MSGSKPCDKVAGLPCHGTQGTCFGPVQWEGKSSNKGPARELSECEWLERCRTWWKNKQAGRTA